MAAESDRVDMIMRQWQDTAPDVDLSPLEIVTRLVRAAHFLQSRMDRVAAAYGLSHRGDLDVLAELYRGGPPYETSPSLLAEGLLLTAGGMTIRLNRLQGLGLLDRHPNPLDGRGILVRLTNTGEELVDDAFKTLLKSQRESIELLNRSDRTELAHLLRVWLVALGDVPAFRPAIVAPRKQGIP